MPTEIFPARTTLVMAHPDDEVLRAGSVVARLERAVTSIATSGPSRLGLQPCVESRMLPRHPLGECAGTVAHCCGLADSAVAADARRKGSQKSLS